MGHLCVNFGSVHSFAPSSLVSTACHAQWTAKIRKYQSNICMFYSFCINFRQSEYFVRLVTTERKLNLEDSLRQNDD